MYDNIDECQKYAEWKQIVTEPHITYDFIYLHMKYPEQVNP